MKKVTQKPLSKTQAKKMHDLVVDPRTGDYHASFKYQHPDMQDEFQEGCLRTCKTIAKNDTRIKNKGYIKIAGLSVRIDNYRRHDPQNFLSIEEPKIKNLLEEKRREDTNPLEELIRNEESERVWKIVGDCLRKLPEPRRKLLKLYFEGFSNEEIASALNWSLEKVRIDKNAAISQLRTKLRDKISRMKDKPSF